VTLPSGIETSRVVWEPDPVTKSADELLRARANGDAAASRLELAELWLRLVLAERPLPQPRIKARAKADGHSWAMVRRAKDELGVVAEKTDFKGGCVWRLPDMPDDDGDDEE
jgi:putative DNA primase/helicase